MTAIERKRERNRLWMQKWRAEHAEENREYQRLYARKRNRTAKHRAYMKKYRFTHRAELNAASRRWAMLNRDYCRAKLRRWRRANAADIAERKLCRDMRRKAELRLASLGFPLQGILSPSLF